MQTGLRPSQTPDSGAPAEAEAPQAGPIQAGSPADQLTPRQADRLGQLSRLSGHLVVALVALVVIGGATRVMQAGLACPDWPLCYGVLLPGRQMNLQVFLEWFHRLDAFVVGVALLVMAAASLVGRRQLPGWLPWASGLALALVAVQGGLGALTVTRLLASSMVTAHLAAALSLLALLSGLHQALKLQQALKRHSQPGTAPLERPWRLVWGLAVCAALLLVFCQSLLGAWMASHWAADRCLAAGDDCRWLLLHRQLAPAAGGAVLAVAALAAALRPALPRSTRLLALGGALLVVAQLALGVTTLRLALAVPAVTIAHQLGAALLVAVLAGLLGQLPGLAGRPPSTSPSPSPLS